MEHGPQGEVFAIAGLLAVYNNAAGLLPRRLHDRFYVLMNLSFLGLLLAWVLPATGLSLEEMGLMWPNSWISGLWGLALGGAIVSPLVVLTAFPRFMRRAQDPRLAGLTWRQVLGRALIRIPLGTALFEEMLFRGVLFGLLSRWGTAEAVWASSLVLSLWHIVPTLHLMKFSPFRENRVLAVLALLGGLLATFLGGVFFGLMRFYTGSVVGPIVAHGVINSVALVAAYLRQRTQMGR